MPHCPSLSLTLIRLHNRSSLKYSSLKYRLFMPMLSVLRHSFSNLYSPLGSHPLSKVFVALENCMPAKHKCLISIGPLPVILNQRKKNKVSSKIPAIHSPIAFKVPHQGPLATLLSHICPTLFCFLPCQQA